jgi:methionine-gamma-lyase
MLRDLLPRLGIDVTVVDQTDAAAFESALKPATKLIIVESPSNPAMRLTDLRAVSAIAKSRGIITMIDNTFATPVNQRPAALGIDLIAHSATKFMGGHSDIIAGAVAGSAAHLDKIWETSLILGSVLGPMDSWLLLRGLRTLPLRVEKHNRSALAIARLLESRSEVKAVNYPGLESHPQHELARQQMSGYGGILSFELHGGVDAAERFISNMTLASRAASVGGHETLVVRPAAMLAHQVSEEEFIKTGVNPGLIRLSVGLEDERDLLDDIKRALQS